MTKSESARKSRRDDSRKKRKHPAWLLVAMSSAGNKENEGVEQAESRVDRRPALTKGASRPGGQQGARPPNSCSAEAARGIDGAHLRVGSRVLVVGLTGHPELVELCDKWLTGNIKLVAWDFDNTILKIHAYKEKIEPHQVAGRWRSDVCDLPLVRIFVRRARMKNLAEYRREKREAELRLRTCPPWFDKRTKRKVPATGQSYPMDIEYERIP